MKIDGFLEARLLWEFHRKCGFQQMGWNCEPSRISCRARKRSHGTVHPKFRTEIPEKIARRAIQYARTKRLTGVGMMKKFRVVVWCESCRGDDEGCFGGGNELIDGAFESWEAAERAGVRYCSDLPYQYRIVHDYPFVQDGHIEHERPL
jgi:hypothetical protein